MVPKHRRSEVDPSLAPASTADYWSEVAGYAVTTAPGWAADPEGHTWQEWGPPPALPPDHPSAPMPRVQFPAGQPPGPMPPYREPSAPGLPRQRPGGPAAIWSAALQLPDAGYDNPPPASPARRDAPGYPRQSGPGWHETTEAQDYAAAIREAAEREAAAIREAAQREAAELRDRLDSMSGELSRMAAYVTESLAVPAMPATAPALPAARPAPPGLRPAAPRPAWPATKVTRPATRPAGPRTTPATKRPRQLKAMRIATVATAALLLFAVATGAAEVGMHGFKFFVFRETGVGQTGGTEDDQQFLNRQAAAAHHAGTPAGQHTRHQPAGANGK